MTHFNTVLHPFSIQEATCEDWIKITDLSTETEGWAMAYEDFSVWNEAFEERDAEFFVAKETDGDVLGFIGIAKFGPDVAAIGNFYVSPANRGKGIGNKLFEKVTQTSKAEGRNLSLNAAFKMSKSYARKGFENFSTWRLRQHVITGADTACIANLASQIYKITVPTNIDFAKIVKYDKSVAANIDRSEWLKAWINHPAGWSKVALNADDEVVGYGTARVVTQNRLVFGPLYANDNHTAAALMKSILEEDDEYMNREIQCLSPSTNKAMIKLFVLLSSEGGTYEHQGEDGICQFTKEVLPVDVDKVFAISDVALCFI